VINQSEEEWREARRKLRERHREERRRQRDIQKAAHAYFEAMHGGERHIERYPDLDNANFRAWLDFSGTGKPLGEEVGEAAAVLADDCPGCSITVDGELYDWEIEEKRLAFAEEAEQQRLALAEQAQRQAVADEIMVSLGFRDNPRKEIGERLGGFIPGELQEDDDLMRNVKKT
jgi:hypothetical protein